MPRVHGLRLRKVKAGRRGDSIRGNARGFFHRARLRSTRTANTQLPPKGEQGRDGAAPASDALHPPADVVRVGWAAMERSAGGRSRRLLPGGACVMLLFAPAVAPRNQKARERRACVLALAPRRRAPGRWSDVHVAPPWSSSWCARLIARPQFRVGLTVRCVKH